MKILLKNTLIIDKESHLNNERRDILIDEGKIWFPYGEVNDADKVIEGRNLCISKGWFDMRVKMGEPGFEFKEDINSISLAAASGGFTEIACLPNTNPPIQTKESVSYIKNRTQNALVQIYPIASVTVNNAGEDLTEMIDLNRAGAVAFSDGTKPIWHTDVLLKSLQYTQYFNGVVINHAEDRLLTHGAQMNESILSNSLGLKGFPKLAEELIIARDIQILEYTGGKLHFAHVSSPKSLKLIKDAKEKGLNVTCDIAAYQLVLDENNLSSFDTNFKVNPPLRSKEDIKYFWEALKDGTIDVIVSDHIPQDIESKKLEFDLAEFGIQGLETLFPILYSNINEMLLEDLIYKFTDTPRNLLQLNNPTIEEGANANVTIFDIDETTTLTPQNTKSLSHNNPFMNMELKGKVIAVVNNNKFYFN